MAPVVQAEWMARMARTMPAEPAGLAAQLPRVSCQPAVALALLESVVPGQLVEPLAAVELQVVPAQLVLAMQRVAAGP
jgi:hypothetical protein